MGANKSDAPIYDCVPILLCPPNSVPKSYFDVTSVELPPDFRHFRPRMFFDARSLCVVFSPRVGVAESLAEVWRKFGGSLAEVTEVWNLIFSKHGPRKQS